MMVCLNRSIDFESIESEVCPGGLRSSVTNLPGPRGGGCFESAAVQNAHACDWSINVLATYDSSRRTLGAPRSPIPRERAVACESPRSMVPTPRATLWMHALRTHHTALDSGGRTTTYQPVPRNRRLSPEPAPHGNRLAAGPVPRSNAGRIHAPHAAHQSIHGIGEPIRGLRISFRSTPFGRPLAQQALGRLESIQNGPKTPPHPIRHPLTHTCPTQAPAPSRHPPP